MIGRRVGSMDAFTEPGDYFRNGSACWFLLPIGPELAPEGEDDSHAMAREHRHGLHRVSTDPPVDWSFRECPDGSLEIRPSILTSDWTGWQWHGYLDEGHSWRTV